MGSQAHAILGLAVLLVNLGAGIWAWRAARRGITPSGLAAAVMAGVGLLLLQLLIGFDLWARGARPAASPLAELHIAGPVIGLLAGVVLVFFRRATGTRGEAARWAIASLLIAVVTLASYAIGEMGNVRG